MTGGPRAVVMPLAEALARSAVPVATLAAMASFAAREVDPTASAEGGYLAVLAAAVLAPAAFLAPRPALEAGLGAVLATAAVWALPAGPGRGAAVAAILLATLAVAAGRRLARSPPALPLAVSVPLALGLQALLRSDLLLRPRGRAFVLLLALPLAGAAATSLLSRRHGRRAAVAAGLALAATPGWTIATTLALLALAGGDSIAALAERDAAGAPVGPDRRWRVWAIRAAAVAAILLPIAWSPRAGWPAAAAGFALASPDRATIPALILAMLAFHSGEAPLDGLLLAATAILCVPAVARSTAERWRWALAGILLAFGAYQLVPAGATEMAALAAPLALLALATRDEGPEAGFQRAWTAALLGGTALFAAYPWLRDRPLGDLLALLGPAPLAAIVAVAAVLAIGIALKAQRAVIPQPRATPWAKGLRAFGPLAPRARDRQLASAVPLSSFVAGDSRWATQDDNRGGSAESPLAPAGIALALLFAGILIHLPPPATPLLPAGQAVRLSADAPAWEAPLPPDARGVAVVSSLENGAGVAAGAEVASLAIDPGLRFTLAAGRGTADWAARRADVARAREARGEAAPHPWLSWVAGGFFGQRYRRVFALPAGSGSEIPRRLHLELARGLPPDAALAIYRLEVLR